MKKTPASEEALMFQALASTIRITLLRIIKTHNDTLAVENLIQELAKEEYILTQPSVSHHLRILRDAHLILSFYQGTYMYYCINLSGFVPMQKILSTFTQES